jgi:hypothetical protein
MAIAYASVDYISRGAGRSATGAAAYRSGMEIRDERTGRVHDYTKKRGILYTDMALPENAPAWARGRARYGMHVKRQRSAKTPALPVKLSSRCHMSWSPRIATGW